MKIVNLLPKSKQQNLRRERVAAALQTFLVLSVVVYILAYASQVGVRFLLAARARAAIDATDQLRKQVDRKENAQVRQQVKEVNDRISDFNTLANTAPRVSQVLRAFAKLPPEGLVVSSLTVDPVTKYVSVTGFSPTRELVIDFYNRIKADETEFTNVDYPLENVSQPKNIQFNFSFTVQDALLKPSTSTAATTTP